MNKPSEADIINNSNINTLYRHSISEDLECFRVIFEEESESETRVHVRISPRMQLKVIYSTSNEDIKSFYIHRIKSGETVETLTLSNSSITQLRAFLEFVSKIDFSGVVHNKIRLPYNSDAEIDIETQNQILEVLKKNNGVDLIKEILNNEVVTSEDIVNTGYRKSELDKFNRLLTEESYITEFKKIVLRRPNAQNEKAWQDFFMSNQWIFGYGLDYRFEGVLQKEFHTSNTDASGSGSVIADFLLGDKKYTSFVEIKLPTTPLFSRSQNRSGCWKLSTELIDAFSQILEQKASGQIKLEQNELFDENGDTINQKSYDSKTILIVGNLEAQIESDNDLIKKIKLKTFELFRRDSRNVEIITYDELYERAKFITETK